jgi:hypothetical protein
VLEGNITITINSERGCSYMLTIANMATVLTIEVLSDICIYTSWFPGVARVYRGLSSWTLLKLSVAFLLQPPRSIVAVDISVVTELLPSYQQFLIVGLLGYESCTRCLATAKLEHTYFLGCFGPLGRMPHFSLLILFLILIQSGKRRKLNYVIHRKIVMSEHAYIYTYIHFYIDR